MRTTLPTLLTLLAWGFLAAASAAQTPVHVVDDGGGAGVDFTSLQAAVDAAASGDTLLVKDGVYGGATIDGKALRFSAELGASVQLTGALRVRNLAAAQPVFARGLVVQPIAGEPPSSITDCAGVVWLEECTLVGPAFGFFGSAPHGLVVENALAVDLMDCALVGSNAAAGLGGQGAQGLQATGSTANLYDCVLLGGPGNPGSDGGDGARVNGGTVLLSATTVSGGDGGDADGFFQACPGDGGDGLVLISTAVAREIESVFAGGAGGRNGAPGCVQGAPGAPAVLGAGTLTTLGPLARRFDSTSPVREGGTSVLTFQGSAGEFVFTAYTALPGGFYFAPWFGYFLLGSPFVFTSIGTLPGSGVLTLPINVGMLNPAFESLVVYHQAIFFTQTFQLILGSGSSIVILDSAF